MYESPDAGACSVVSGSATAIFSDIFVLLSFSFLVVILLKSKPFFKNPSK
jgi:hypothetical protein